MNKKVMISACLLGENCRYNGGNSDQDPGQNGGDGGGSRNNGTNQTNTAGTNNDHGKVIITKL